MLSYICTDEKFIKGIADYLKIKAISKENVVETFAGTGFLGKNLDLPIGNIDNETGLSEGNISDSFLWRGSDLSQDSEWIDEATWGVADESAFDTIIRLHVEEGDIKLLIMAMPSEDEQAYQAAKALFYLFNAAEIFFIGPDDYNTRVASSNFYDHTVLITDDNFYNLIFKKYNEKKCFSSQNLFEVEPQLRKFITCNDKSCDCKNNKEIIDAVKNYQKTLKIHYP